jgi:hypothetical protein
MRIQRKVWKDLKRKEKILGWKPDDLGLTLG